MDLKEKSVPAQSNEIITDMYGNIYTTVKTTVGITNPFTVKVGHLHGPVLSPYLFALIFDAFTADIQEEDTWCMLFADDVVLVIESVEDEECQILFQK